MKKINQLLLLITLLYSALAFSQVSKYEIGIEGGVSSVSLRGNGFVADKNVADVSFATGFSLLYHFNDRFSLKTNIFYERKGNTINYFYHELPFDKMDVYIKEELEAQYRLDYLTLPVLARYSFGKQNNFFVNAGGYIGYLLKSMVISSKFSKGGRQETDNTGQFSRLDFGFVSGVGGQVNLKKDIILSVELRNSLGLQNIGKEDDEYYQSDLILKKDGLSTHTTSLLIGLSYRLSKSIKRDDVIDE